MIPGPGHREKRTDLRLIFRALRHKNYRLFSAGQCVSLVGTWMQYIAVSWLVYRLTNSAFMLGLVGFVGQLPTFVISPLAGVLGDRYDRRRMLLATQALAMVQAAVTTGFLGLGAYLWLWIAILSAMKTKRAGRWAWTAVVVFFVHSQFSVPSASSLVLLALLLGNLYADRENGLSFRFANPIPEPARGTVASVLICAVIVVSYFLIKPAAADVQFRKAESASHNDPIAALQDYESALRLNPRVPLYSYGMGKLCLEQAARSSELSERKLLINKAVQVYQSNLALHPYDSDAYIAMGTALMWMTELGGEDHRNIANQCFEKAAQLDPALRQKNENKEEVQ